jgi:integrase/recombinase XerC
MTDSQSDQKLAAALLLLESSGVTVEELAAFASRGDDQSTATSGYPTLADHIADFEATLKPNTKRTWATHYRRLVDGVAPQCRCDCDACLDLDGGCSCDCKACDGKVGIDPCGDLVLRPKAVGASTVKRWADVAERMSRKRAVGRNINRAKRRKAALPAHGHGGRENAVTAYRALFEVLIEDELWTTNPAMRADKPQRSDTRRRGLRDVEVPEFLDTVASGGDDPELDTLLCWFHLETGARRAGAISLTVGKLHFAGQTVELYEKFSKLADQPVSGELLDALLAHAINRGGPSCDPDSPHYDPSRPVFYFRHGRPNPAPLTDRRYDTLFDRIQRELPWANEIHLAAHALRKTGASIVERIAGTQTARLFLRHGRRSTTDTYVESWEERLAEALVIMTGSPHPAAPEASAQLDADR